jgi:hypothetical protein
MGGGVGGRGKGRGVRQAQGVSAGWPRGNRPQRRSPRVARAAQASRCPASRCPPCPAAARQRSAAPHRERGARERAREGERVGHRAGRVARHLQVLRRRRRGGRPRVLPRRGRLLLRERGLQVLRARPARRRRRGGGGKQEQQRWRKARAPAVAGRRWHRRHGGALRRRAGAAATTGWPLPHGRAGGRRGAAGVAGARQAILETGDSWVLEGLMAGDSGVLQGPDCIASI